ncbi:MAG: Stp1/IreP family PP2C-type Ser/Thr phosphatase [bacterium]
MQLIVSGKSIKGMARECNQDYFGLSPNNGMSEDIYVLADGIGGAVGGELASRMAVETIIECFHLELEELKLPANAMKHSILKANSSLRKYVLDNPNLSGMGTTVVAIYFDQKKAYVAHVGDSCCYRIHDKRIEKLTTDHSLVQELYQNGHLTLKQMEAHPKRNIITRALGIEDTVEIDINVRLIEEDDVFLLCSDGLNGVVAEEDMAKIVVQNIEDMDGMCGKLIDTAMANNSTDDISVVAIRVTGVKRKWIWRMFSN